MSKFFWRTTIGIAITAALLALLFHYIDWHHIATLLQHLDWRYCLIAFFLYQLIYLARAYRFRLLALQTPYRTMLSITAVHNLLLRLLPMRAGDLSYAILIKRAGTAGFTNSVLYLILLRLLDSTTVMMIFAVTLWSAQREFPNIPQSGIVLSLAAALFGIFSVIFFHQFIRALVFLLRVGLEKIGLAARPKPAALVAKLKAACSDFEISPPLLIKISASTLLQWLLTFSVTYFVMQSLNIPVSTTQTVLGSTAAIVSGFLPIGGIGSFGTLEAGWALGFRLVGLTQSDAIASGFGFSIITFAFTLLLGAIGWVWLAKRPNGPPTKQ